MKHTLLSLLLVSLGACSVGPDYQRPVVETPTSYRQAAGQNELANSAWWQQLQDPTLNQLVDEGLQQNLDLRAAAARVDAYYGQLGVTRSQFYPQVGGGLDGSRNKASERTNSPAPATNPFNSVQALGFVSWELDLFGRIRRLSEAAQAELAASEQGRRAAALGVASSVASGYVSLRTLDKQLEISRATAKSRLDALTLFEKRFKGGVISAIELNQAQSEAATAQAAVPEYQRQVALQEHALSLLLGRNPGPIARGKSIDQLALPAVPAGLPSELLERRPDVLSAEQSLIAANARIGAAKALYFPTLSLTGSGGVASTSLSNLMSNPASVWNVGASLTAPIFTAGAISGQVEAAKAQQQAALLSYQQTVQNAFKEVEDGLVNSDKGRDKIDAQQKQVIALRSYAKFARMRYEGGYSSYLEVLDAERSLFNAELDYTRTQSDNFTRLISLYKALGGGWNEADKLAARPANDIRHNPSVFP